MSTLLFTILIAFVGVLIAVSLLGISWLLTGKSKIKPGACGKDPTKLRSESCEGENISCGLCNKKDIK